MSLLLLLPGPGPSGSLWAQSGEIAPARPAEYMIYQYPDISMVVKIDALETEFDAQITGPERALLLDSMVAGRRIGPIFQFVEAADNARQLMIKINPVRAIERSRVSMELIQLSSRERNDMALAQGYRLFSHGVERLHASDTTTWAMKVYSLRSAAQVFADFGMLEMRLWSEYYAAHLALHQLSDFLTALEFAEQLQNASRRAGFEMLELASVILESDALMMAIDKAPDSASRPYFDRVHPTLQRQVFLAGELGLASEKARALFTDGRVYELQNELPRAIERYQQALDVSLTSGNLELVNEIRATAAAVYEEQGRTAGAIAMLDDITGDLAGTQAPGGEEEAALELADNLFEKGRLLNSDYRFGEAAVELARALQIQQSVAGAGAWGLTGLELGWSQFSIGYWDDAARTLEQSLPRTARSGNQDALFRAFGNLAVIARSRGHHEQVEQLREQQEYLQGSQDRRTELLFEQGLDAMSRGRSGLGDAVSKMRSSREAALASENRLASYRADLQLCLLQLERSGKGSCSETDVRSQVEALRSSGIPRLSLESEFALMRLLKRNGRYGPARQSANRLVGRLAFFQAELPGVLGAWYWENREQILREYLSITLAMTLGGARETMDGGPMLQALEQVRKVEDIDSLKGSGSPSPNGTVRALLARCESAGGDLRGQLADEVGRQLKRLEAQSGSGAAAPTELELTELLSGLDRNTSVLTYYFSDNANYAVIGKRGGVRIVRLAASRTLAEQLEGISRLLASPDGQPISGSLERIGSALLDPISSHLSSDIYLLAAGPLNGIPFDALRYRGDYLARTHRVVLVRSLETLKARDRVLALSDTDGIFLAGNPQASQELFTYKVSTSVEIETVRDRFIGPGLHIVQGVALQNDEFADPRFNTARLVHLAMPGIADLEVPERSSLSLSGSPQAGARQFLVPADVRRYGYAADLVVLSGLAVSGQSATLFSNRLGFTSDFLDAGAGAVITSLSPAVDEENARFLGEFYDELKRDSDIAGALRRTRLSRMDSGDDTIFPTWARFQLHIR